MANEGLQAGVAVTVAPFRNNVTRGFELLITDDGVPNVPVATTVFEKDARLFASAAEMRAVLQELADQDLIGISGAGRAVLERLQEKALAVLATNRA